MCAGAEHVRRHADGVAAGLQRLDRRAGGDAAHHRHRDRTIAIVPLAANASASDLAEGASDDTRREAATAIAVAAGGEFRKLDDFDGACAVGKAANEAAL